MSKVYDILALIKAADFEGIVNYNIAAKKRGDSITFLRKIVKGATDDSYGIEVAQLAGVPAEITRRAKEILRTLEETRPEPKSAPRAKEESYASQPITFADSAAEEIKEKLKTLDINTLTPIEAMGLLYEWKKTILES